MSKKRTLKAPFPAFGGKGTIAHLVWERFGKVDNFIEPFFNSGAILFKNPNGPAHNEAVNDLDSYISNFWRAVKAEPEVVAEHADWPVNEVDMHARHRWLVESKPAIEMRERVASDPDYYDAKIAGWWCWGICLWIGSGWCNDSNMHQCLPRLHHDQGMNCKPEGQQKAAKGKRPNLTAGFPYGNGTGVAEKPNRGKPKGESSLNWKARPDLSTEKGLTGRCRPQLGDAYSRGRGVHGNDSANTCQERRDYIVSWMKALSDRLRNTRVCCGHWDRVCGSETVTTRLGVTAVFLDPPYRLKLKGGKKNRDSLYTTDKGADLDKLNDEVLAFCRERGQDKNMRIALCSYEGEGNEILEAEGWSVMAWKSNGYGNSVNGKANAARERVWFSPHCIVPERDTYPLFAAELEEEN